MIPTRKLAPVQASAGERHQLSAHVAAASLARADPVLLEQPVEGVAAG